ncbi:CLCA1-like protein [Mya arenaria]|uniref:CLCA1-like protein n=1 Tax=Mya arenaria TaxID=6604 RepID=A0ABY7G2I9_MYAAR|nr:CLCA1-like protein [Mya arenaria]
MILVILLTVCGFTSAIVLKDNGYEDVHIVIHDSVVENWELVERIKKVFTDASQHLFEATENRVYYRKINIKVPKAWTVTKEKYLSVPSLSLTSYVIVEEGIIQTPHVKPRGCGKEGQYMYLTPSFLLETGSTIWGSHESVIVHEWGHLRWGLYDEYAGQIKFYQHAGKWNPVRCTEKFEGMIGIGTSCNDRSSSKYCDYRHSGNKMHSKCRFCPSITQSTNTSIMSYQYVPSLTLFCDKDDPATPEWKRHNRQAPNRQNEVCGMRSAWEVMREHADFTDGASPVLPHDTYTSPEFSIIQETEAIRVFVLDVSGSMSGLKIKSLHDTGVYIVQEVLRNGSWLGIVLFSSSATRASEIIQITDSNAREELIQNLPSTANGGTCIGCGINSAIEMLETTFGSAKGCEIILMSDGDDGDQYEFTTAERKAISTGVVIHTVSISQAADPRMINLASETGGKHFNYLDQGSISFAAVFSEAVSGGVPGRDNQYVTILSESVHIPSDRLDFAFQIESGLGNDPDSLESDGIYSVYLLPKCLTNGRLNIRVTVNGQANNTYAIKFINGALSEDETSSYEIRYADDIDTIVDNFSSAKTLDIGNVSLTPKQSGMTETIVISVNAEETYVDTAYLGIAAVDEAGNQGKVSNIVSVVVAKGFRMSFEGETNYTETEDEIITAPVTTTSRSNVDDNHIGLIVGVSAGVVIGMVVIGLILFLVLRKRREQSSKEDVAKT